MKKNVFNKIKWWHLIIALAGVFILFKTGIIDLQKMATLSVINPETNETYSCNTTIDCYDQILSSFSGTLPAITCQDGVCVETACLAGGENNACITNSVCCSHICGASGYCLDCSADLKQTCWDQTEITVKTCTGGLYVATNSTCPAYECYSDGDCSYKSDENCDGTLESVDGQCILHKCTEPRTKRCTQAELIFGKYKIFIIAGGALLVGLIAYALGRKNKGKK